MKRTTLLIPPELKRRAERRARVLGLSFGELVRNALEASLRESAADRKVDPMFADEAVFRNSTPPADLSLEHDKYLYEKS